MFAYIFTYTDAVDYISAIPQNVSWAPKEFYSALMMVAVKKG